MTLKFPANEWAPGIWAGAEGAVISSKGKTHKELSELFGKPLADELVKSPNTKPKTVIVKSVDFATRTVTFGE